MKHLVCSVLAAVLSLSYCIAQSSADNNGSNSKTCKPTAKKKSETHKQPRKDDSIGTATMASDGTIILDLRTKGADGTIGEARFIYPKNHKRYSEILEHLGGMKPGESKSVPPWPDK